MAEWQSIDTAPRDGRHIAGAVWSTNTRRWLVMDAYWCKGLREPKWIFDGWPNQISPTHWMPLPPEPERRWCQLNKIVPTHDLIPARH